MPELFRPKFDLKDCVHYDQLYSKYTKRDVRLGGHIANVLRKCLSVKRANI